MLIYSHSSRRTNPNKWRKFGMILTMFTCIFIVLYNILSNEQYDDESRTDMQHQGFQQGKISKSHQQNFTVEREVSCSKDEYNQFNQAKNWEKRLSVETPLQAQVVLMDSDSALTRTNLVNSQEKVKPKILLPGTSAPTINVQGPGNRRFSPMNLKWTKYLIHKKDLCNISNSKGSSPTEGNENSTALTTTNKKLLLIMIQSARKNFLEREAIRNTYGKFYGYKNWEIRLVFLLGRGPSHKDIENGNFEAHIAFENIRMAWEIETFQDIIMGPFHESPKHSCKSFSTIMGYRWASTICPQASYIVKANDDSFIDILEIIDNTIPKLEEQKSSFYCSLRRAKLSSGPDVNFRDTTAYAAGKKPLGEKNINDITSHSQVSQPQEVSYCDGHAYLADAKAVAKLYQMVIQVPFFLDPKFEESEDVFVTGRLRKAFLDLNPNESLHIIHHEHLFNHETDKCDFLEAGMPTEKKLGKRRIPFRKIEISGKFISDMWCFWKDALGVKKQLTSNQMKRFFLGYFTI